MSIPMFSMTTTLLGRSSGRCPDEHEADKILVRSNGTVTYTGKDIAYQMWKLGILGMDFFYRPFYVYSDGSTVWTTASRSSNGGSVPEFGHGETVYNVIDSRQSYPQEIVRKGVAAIAPSATRGRAPVPQVAAKA